jgi:hypothetical protein
MDAMEFFDGVSLEELSHQILVDARTTTSECRLLAQELAAGIREEFKVQVYGMNEVVIALRDWHRAR